MCEVLANALQAKFQMVLMEEQKRVSKLPLADIKLIDDMSKEKDYDRDRAFVELMSGESVSVAMELISGMAKAIEGFVKEESSKRDLSGLTTHFL